jgi:hypothetical protein
MSSIGQRLHGRNPDFEESLAQGFFTDAETQRRCI